MQPPDRAGDSVVSEKAHDLDRQTEVRFLKGVGPRRAEHFAKLGVHTVGDLLEYFPHRYEFMPPLTLMKDMERDQQVTVLGEVVNMRFNRRSRPAYLEVFLRDDTSQCRLIWFHGGYLRDKFLPEDKVAAWGKVGLYKEILQITNPKWTKPESADDIDALRKGAQPVYPATEALSAGQIAGVFHESLEMMLSTVRERYEKAYIAERQLPGRRQALQWIHQPVDQEQIDQARRRLVFDEFFLMELGIGLRREQILQTQPAFALSSNDQLDKRIRRLFPFLLTTDQDTVIDEICADMACNKPMNRLLQGDVGSGKTVVALYAALLAIGHHKQVAIMTPTEILAEQHFLSIERYLRDSRVKRLLLRGGLTGKQRTEVMDQIKNGEIDIVVGTQALLQEDVAFKELALVVIDEQHKFGVRQRQTIRSKDIAPHYLVMTATPIPRTMAMTIFGDLDVSTIAHLPPGRQPISTRWVPADKLPDAWEFIRKKVRQGQQAYFVYPRLEETLLETEGIATMAAEPESAYATGQLKAAIAEQKMLQNEVYPEFNVGLLHGQMDSQQKQQVMDEFRRGKIHILVATVVIEVGVDVPNATIMVVEHADRFGLAQLHQLRGRIGRGDKASHCFLFAGPTTDEACQRLEVMEKTASGFDIAEEDLRLRGPGHLFGTAQHGLPELKIANILEDIDLLRMARRDAFTLAKEDPFLKKEKHQVLREELLRQFGDTLQLVDVG